MKRRSLLHATPSVLIVVVALVGVWTSGCSNPDLRAPVLLEQIHTAFELYASEWNGLYPPVSPEPGAFVPDMDAFSKYLARLPERKVLSAYLTGKCGVQLCYLGYLLPSQQVTLAFLDECEKHGLANLRHENVDVEGKGLIVRYPRRLKPVTWERVWRMREGKERFLITDVGQPAGSRKCQAWVPVLWEMADTTPEAGGWVLYMDGHTEWQSYGSFPMTGKTIDRLRDFMRAPAVADPVYRVDNSPPGQYRRTKQSPSPVHQIAADVVDSLPLASFKLADCDVKPSVEVRGHRGYRISIESGIEVALFPADISVDDKFKYLIWPRGSEKENTVLADLGVGQGYHWFARASVWHQDNLREDFGLTGGDDRLQHMIDANAFPLMPRLAGQAMPYLESAVTDDEMFDHFSDAIKALDQIGDAEARKLIRAAFDPDNKNVFRNARALSSRADDFAYRRGQVLTDTTVDAVVGALLTHENEDELARMALVSATVTGMFATHQSNRIGLAALKRLPRDVVERALKELRGASSWQGDRIENELWGSEE